jgi:hypothetical protein
MGDGGELSLIERKAARGISHNKVKFAKWAPAENFRNAAIKSEITKGISTGTLTTSTRPLAQRGKPNPPGTINGPRKYWTATAIQPNSNVSMLPLSPEKTDRLRK